MPPQGDQVDDRRQRARAMWSYTGMKQPAFAERAGIHPDRLRAAINDARVAPPTLDELVAMADAAGIPTAFALEGWRAADRVAQVEQRLAKIEQTLATQTGVPAAPAPAGELGRRLEDFETTAQDPPEPDSDQGTDAQTGSGR